MARETHKLTKPTKGGNKEKGEPHDYEIRKRLASIVS